LLDSAVIFVQGALCGFRWLGWPLCLITEASIEPLSKTVACFRLYRASESSESSKACEQSKRTGFTGLQQDGGGEQQQVKANFQTFQ
jgi:hypothetical protein